MGAWLAGSLVMWFVATQNFRTVDRVLARPTPGAAPVLRSLPAETPRPLLRHLASELNRVYFVAWGLFQIPLGVAVLGLMAWSRRRAEALLAAAMLALVVLLLFGVTPQIVSLGRSLDFVPRNPPPPQMSTFWRLHAAYTGLDLVKVLLGSILACRLAR